jgi:lysophospholipase L1-like esterase
MFNQKKSSVSMKNSVIWTAGLLLGLMILTSCASSQQEVKEYPSLHGQITYFQEKHELYNTFPIEKGDIVFMGDDVADRGMWDAFYGANNVKNRGIALEGTECTLFRIKDIAKNHPSKLIISTGLFDLKKGCSVEQTKERIVKILKETRKVSPRTDFYFLSIVPDLGSKKVEGSLADSAKVINEYIHSKFPGNFIELNTLLCDASGYINESYCFGDNRINGAGYEIIARAVAPYIGLEARNTITNDPIIVHSDRSADPARRYAEAYKERYAGRSAHYLSRLSIFRSIPNTNQKVVMLGNSITNNCWWNELLEKDAAEIINRGISGDTILGILDRLDEVADENPAKICMLAGVNDMLEDAEVAKEEVWARYEKLLTAIREKMPEADLVISTTIPLNPLTKFYPGVNEKVEYLNDQLKANTQKYGYSLVEIAPILSDANNDLSSNHTCDGIHLLPSAYHLWKELL